MSAKTDVPAITVTRTALADALERVACAVPRGNLQLPVLGMVRVAPASVGIELTGTNLDATVSTTLAADTAPTFTPFLLPVARLQAVTAQLPAGAVVIQPTKAGARLSIERTRFDLVGLPISEFPSGVIRGLSPVGTLSGSAFVSTLKRFSTHMSEERTGRPTLCGIHLVSDGSRLRIEATDGYRLARETIDAPGAGPLDVIVPSTAVAAIVRLFAAGGDITVQSDETHLGLLADIGGDSVTLIARTSEGPFPPVAAAFGQDLPNRARVDRLALLAAVRRVAALALKDRIKIRLMWSADGVVVGAIGNDEIGSAEDVVPCQYTGAPGTEIYFQPGYLIDALTIRTADAVDVDLKGESRAMALRDAGAADPQNLVMPIRG